MPISSAPVLPQRAGTCNTCNLEMNPMATKKNMKRLNDL